MLFNSFAFALFLPVVLLLYYLLPHKAQNRMLLAASIFFYACWDWRFLAPLLFSTVIDFYCASRMARLIDAGRPIQDRRPYLWLSTVTNLGLLGFFKYFNFFSENLHELLTAVGIPVSPFTLQVILPVGISFYTFQALSYTIDVYRGELHAISSFWDFLLAVLYFPHLVAGPIQRASSLLPQVIQPRHTTRQQVLEGIHLMVWGFFKKVFIADHLSPIVDATFAKSQASGGEVWLACLAFTVQIYCDFSGYTDIARGVAKLMGFEFVLNFNLPYFARNPQEFWSRWHISLSSWLRDYLYVSLGGNRNGTAQTYRNLFLTMVIGGLWHGAAWNFVLWGIYHGTLLIVHRLWVQPWEKRLPAGHLLAGLQIPVMFLLTVYGWLLFRATSLSQVIAFSRAMAHPLEGWANLDPLSVFLFSLPLILVQCVQYFSRQLFWLHFPWLPAEARSAVYAALLYATLFAGGQPQSFIYFQF
ncbi:MAG TPA: MBOAT family O-acyltransferase [Bryobacteraceae bacterium]|nr:MBOAT family O-acyltransferase [Bryobacteraceae bacterium]